MNDLRQTMNDAMRLMRAGDLHAATRVITKGLGTPNATFAEPIHDDCIVAPYRVIDEAAPPVAAPAGPDAEPLAAPAPGAFTDEHFVCEAGALRYKLFVPTALDTATSAPLLVMLHGCSQSPDDFARGTRMNRLAAQHGYVVAYPAQSQKNNAGKCWNWFRGDDQRRGRGEPALIAALTSHLVDCHRLDARRVYVAGLSAGGAMAAVLGQTYADLYAAIGVHSGLPHGAAHDLPSALAAMRGAGANSPDARRRVPAIVFHGDRDTTVDPCNGRAVIEQCVAARPGADTAPTVLQGRADGGRSYTQRVFTEAGGRVVAEEWIIHDAGHAWSGGDAAGSYTDPSGPDASAQMLRFFGERARDRID